MKKSLILAGMLCIGYANAQYDGKVGINTSEPKATLDVNAETANLNGTTNEGIIAPKLSKTRIANIEASKLTEGTLVYATDAVYTGAEARVSKIDEKGYYFYNGTEWVKVQYQDTNTNDAEWVYDDTTKRINLKRSGKNAPEKFLNAVYYDENGAFRNLGVSSFKGYIGSNRNNVVDINTSDNNVSIIGHNRNVMNSANLIGTTHKIMNGNWLVMSNTGSTGYVAGELNRVVTEFGDTSNHEHLSATGSRVDLAGTGEVGEVIASNAIIESLNPSKVKHLRAAYGRVTLAGGQEVSNAMSTYSVFNIIGNVGKVADASAFTSGLEIYDGTSSTIGNLYAYRALMPSYGGTTGSHSIDNFYAFKYDGYESVNKTHVKLKNNYGLYLGNVHSGSVSNYAIYTNAGKVRVGDLADTAATGNRQVVVDADGVLKVGSAVSTTSTNLKANDTGETCSDTNVGAIHYKEVAITGSTNKKGVFGFCTRQNGTAMWVYLSNGGNIMQGTGTFGQGL